jgi:hypothetical protein
MTGARTLALICPFLAMGTVNIAGAQTAPRESKGYVELHHSPAKGEYTCTIRQHPKGLSLRVNQNGTVGITVRHETYPGTRIYFLIDGRRYSGPEGTFVPLDQHAIEALKRGAVVDYAWQAWPSNREHNPMHGPGPRLAQSVSWSSIIRPSYMRLFFPVTARTHPHPASAGW